MQIQEQIGQYLGRDLVGADGERIGRVEDVYLDQETGEPEWLAVTTGLFGMRRSFVPLDGATWQGEQLTTSYSKQQVKDAPHAEADGALSEDEESRLYGHYGRTYEPFGGGTDAGLHNPYDRAASTGDFGTTGTPGTTGLTGTAGATDDAMTRSEDELHVDVQERVAGRVRLRKWVETERASTTVPVAHDEVRIEREPIGPHNVGDAYTGPEIAESEHEVVLTEQVARAEVETVPQERVRLETERVVGQETVAADLRKEHVEVETEGVADPSLRDGR